ncbi:DsbA family protein [Vibrio proteolyticus]|uniref:Thioredoxin domain-containing protein n=1 Tax=Vibrio proteolyticus NBRC 13287 TaxID=1219065 RepID=U3A1F0_VIBPR|nr:thioredoxin domain-containing protein [Vibrio proteolyticus]GAD67177.1 hypothetical protein VPR01S_06_01950 [Vibrio proteolyticus NBRC 13287]
MFRSVSQLCFSLVIISFIVACQPKDDSKLESEIASLRDEVKQLQQDVADINTQVDEIKTAAAEAKTPKSRILPNQPDFDGNGQIPSMGETSAKIAIIEFSDFQCPYCKRYVDQTFAKIKDNYIDSGKLRYLARDFPLKFHPQAKSAAVAAVCSFQQNAYWPMRDSLFANVRQLGDELYQKAAGELSLDMTKFTACLSDPKVVEKINEDITLATSLGVRGTPSFLIGRIENNEMVEPKLVVGAQDYRVFSALFEQLLAEEAKP